MRSDQKIIQLLKACKAEELPWLRRYLASPYLNRRAVPGALLEALLEHWPDFALPLPSKEALFSVVFPGQAFDDKAWRYMLSDLDALVEAFLVDQAKQHQQADQLEQALAVLSERGLEKSLRHVQRQAEDWMSRAPHRDDAYFRFAHQYFDQQHRYFARKGVRKNDEALQQASDSLDRYYVLGKLRYACAMLERQHILQGDFDTGISEAWLRHLEERPFSEEPLIRLYHQALRTQMDEGDASLYQSMRSSLVGYSPQLPSEDLQALYRIAINYCARKIRQGQDAFVGEALELYTEGIRAGAMLNEGQLSPWTFNNVVKLALRLHRFEWLETFMEHHKHLLPEEHRHNALHYNLAELYYYSQRLDEAQLELLQVEMSDLNYYLGARVLLAKIYSDGQEEEALLSLLASFTVFLKRNKQISAELKHTYLNFCRLLWKMLRVKPGKLQHIQQEIQETQPLTDRAWLLQYAEKQHRIMATRKR
jgi:hypothetical protein